ncbi:MAG: transposase [Pirellulales bacterium]|nr:transposase [Pirellulales bacterium]
MNRRVYDDEHHAQFVTFSCYKRRRLLDHPDARQIVIEFLASELECRSGVCSGFVIMPDHVHAIVWFPETNQLSDFMKQWKQRSSLRLKKFLRGVLQKYACSTDRRDPFWQPRYYPFNLYSEKKAIEKLNYMHLNPVRAGLAEECCDWPHSWRAILRAG